MTRSGTRIVRGPDGRPLTPYDIDRLDRLGTPKARWTDYHKTTAVLAIRGGMLTAAEAISRWRSSREELAEWARLTGRTIPVEHRLPVHSPVLERLKGSFT